MLDHIEIRAEHLRRQHNAAESYNSDVIADALCSGEDDGCLQCQRLLDTWLGDVGTSHYASCALISSEPCTCL